MIPFPLEMPTLRRIYERLDGIVLSGGGDVDPARYSAESVSPYTEGIDSGRDEAEIQLVRWAVEDDRPLLAICRGIQVLNVALGGTLIQDIREEVIHSLRHEAPTDKWFVIPTHMVTVAPDSRLGMALGLADHRLAVNSLHHQAVGTIAPGLQVVAHADDGIIEGLELPEKRFVIGVQWHPEALVDEHPPMHRLFEALVRAAAGS